MGVRAERSRLEDAIELIKKPLFLGALAAALIWLLGFAAPSEASHVSCGDLITEDKTLDSDLWNCPGAGVVIGAAGITLDLNGHTIDGTVPHGPSCGPTFGVDNSGGYDGVIVRDGTVQQFDDGIEVIDGDANRLIGLTVRGHNCDGVFISDTADGNVVRENEVLRNDFRGIVIRDSNDNAITRNTVSANDHAGVAVFRSNGTRIERNSVAGNGRSRGGSAEFGIELVTASHGRVIENTVLRHSGAGIVLFEGSKQNRVALNSVRRYSGNGIVMINGSNGNTILANAVAGSLGSQPFGGIEILDSGANAVSRNSVSSSGLGGIVVGVENEEPARSVRNVISENSACSNPDDGIRIGADAGFTRITGNLACQNGDDGIDVNAPNVVLGDNTANRNLDLGIEGARGIDDLGGNSAWRNGDPRQCTFVFCG